MKKAILALVALIIIITIGISLTTSRNNIVDDTPIQIGLLSIETGPASVVGELQRNAVELALERINSDGGINDRQLEIVFEDTAYDPQKSVSAYQSLKLQGIKYFIADGSPVVAPLRSLFVSDGNFGIVPGATTPGFNDDSNRTCRIALTANQFGPKVSELSFKELGYKNLALFLPQNEYGVGISEKIKESAEQFGGKVIAEEYYDQASQDLRTNITKLLGQKDSVDALFLANITPTVEPLLVQLRDLGWDKPIVSDYYTVQNPSLKNLDLANGIVYLDYEYFRTIGDGDSDVALEFKEKYISRFGTDPVYLAAAHYDSIMILAEAFEKVGSDNVQDVADYIISKDYDGVTGKISFTDDCEVVRDVVYRKVVGGEIVDY